jgi:hypothetical protein
MNQNKGSSGYAVSPIGLASTMCEFLRPRPFDILVYSGEALIKSESGQLSALLSLFLGSDEQSGFIYRFLPIFIQCALVFPLSSLLFIRNILRSPPQAPTGTIFPGMNYNHLITLKRADRPSSQPSSQGVFMSLSTGVSRSECPILFSKPSQVWYSIIPSLLLPYSTFGADFNTGYGPKYS